MTPPPTTPKRIEKLKVERYTYAKLGLSGSDLLQAAIYDALNKINEIIDRLSTIEEEKK